MIYRNTTNKYKQYNYDKEYNMCPNKLILNHFFDSFKLLIFFTYIK